jgi:hypothetical protein
MKLQAMHIAIAYLFEAHTTGNYFYQKLNQSHAVQYLYNNSELLSKSSSGFPIQTILGQDGRTDLLLYIDPVGSFFTIGLENLKFPTAIYLIDVHQNLEQRLAIAQFFDYVFIAQKDYLPAFRERGITNVFWLSLACDPETHRISAPPERLYDIGFVGNRGLVGSERRRLLDRLERCFKLNDLTRKYLPEEIGLIYAQSHMVFNWSVNGDVNMRVFEALCSGRLLLTNAISNGLEDLFTDRKHLVIYRNAEELMELSRYYIDRPDERAEIAKAGQAEVLAKHTYQHRSEQILATIFASGKPQLVAPVRTWPANKRWRAYSQVLANLRQPLAVLQVVRQAWQQGEATWDLAALGMKAALRAVNVHIPLTPNALRHRWQVMRSGS